MSDVFPSTAVDAAATGFVLAHVPRGEKPVLWVQDRLSQAEAGRPYLPGLGGVSVIRVDVTRAADVLWAMEEGLRCAEVSAVIGEIWGDPPALTFTATKRLALRSETAGVPAWLIRRAATSNLSAARERWRVSALPSAPDPDDPASPGDPRWRVDLFRSRWRQPGDWVASYDGAAHRVDLSTPFRDGAVAEADGKVGQRAAG